MGDVAVEDRQAILDVIYRFYRLVDSGRAGETATLFTPTAKITFAQGSPRPGTIEGEQIASAMAARQSMAEVSTRHAISNVSLAAREDGSVSAYSLLTLYRRETLGEPHAVTVADVDEIIVLRHGRWQIQDRLITPIFVG